MSRSGHSHGQFSEDSKSLGKVISYSVAGREIPSPTASFFVLLFMGTVKTQRNGPLYGSTVIGTLAVDGWAVTFGTARRGLGRLRSRPVPSSLYEM